MFYGYQNLRFQNGIQHMVMPIFQLWMRNSCFVALCLLLQMFRWSPLLNVRCPQWLICFLVIVSWRNGRYKIKVCYFLLCTSTGLNGVKKKASIEFVCFSHNKNRKICKEQHHYDFSYTETHCWDNQEQDGPELRSLSLVSCFSPSFCVH